MPRPTKRARVLDPLKDGLREALNSIKAPGEFAAASKLAERCVYPILVRGGMGWIKFPLQEDAARQLIEKARQSPYGKGSETFVDTSVRNTWELDAALLDLSGPWVAMIKSIGKWAAQQLGITGQVNAELYKMLIYEKGAMFKPHTDTEKIPGMFGTLVICLPSAHQGGDLVLKHGGVTKTFKSSEMQPSTFCWFSDVSHEVLPVTSGIRCVLTFNLASPQAVPQPSVGDTTLGNDAVRSALRAWLDSRSYNGGDAKNDCLYYMLDHDYTEASLSFSTLKGVDGLRVRCLKKICEEMDASLLLGVLEKEEEGDCEDDYGGYGGRYGGYGGRYHSRWGEDSEDEDEDDDDDDDDDKGWHSFIEVYETKVTVKKLITAEGATARTGMEIDMDDLESNLIQDDEDPFQDGKCGERDYSGFTGNEGVTATHWYRKTLAVIVPNDCMDRFLLKGIENSSAQTLLSQYLAKCADPETAESALEMVEYLASLAWSSGFASYDYYSSTRSPPEYNLDIAREFFQVVLSHRQYELFGKAFGWFKTELGTLSMPLFEIIGLAARNSAFDFAHIKNILLQYLSTIKVREYTPLLTAISKPGCDSPCTSCVKDWVANEVVPQATTSCLEQDVAASDGVAIVEMIVKYRDLGFFTESFLPVLEKQVHLTPFATAAVLEAIKLASEGKFEKAATLKTCNPVLQTVLDSMKPSQLTSSDSDEAVAALKAVQASRPTYAHAQAFAQRSRVAFFISPKQLNACVALCINHKWDDLALLLSEKIITDVDCIPAAALCHLWIPFLRQLIPTLEDKKVPLSTSRYQELARAILEAYTTKFVGQEPSGVVDNRQRPVSCSCQDCQALNRFLTSDQRVGRFPLAQKRRAHLHGVLDSAGSGCTHMTERSGSPYTLVVTKGLDAGSRAKQEWNKRYNQAAADFAEFDQDKMKILLGDDWERITSMQHLRYTGSAARPAAGTGLTQPRPPMATPAAGTPWPVSIVAGRKRGAADDPIVLD
ncbi:hypothetical protein OQA88_8460 [Cercophora sp. LCS_1]